MEEGWSDRDKENLERRKDRKVGHRLGLFLRLARSTGRELIWGQRAVISEQGTEVP